MIRLGTDPADLERAASWLREGHLVALPTETVYGLGADASNRHAVRAIFAAKGRPVDHPVIVHLPDRGAIDAWAREVPVAARRLAEAFWPGPLTLVLKRAATVDPVITGGQDTVGLRVPGHPVALALLRCFGGALAAPSANRFGHVSPTTADHVVDEFGGEVAAVIDGGACEVGLESTIIDLSGESPKLLRPGMIPVSELEAVLGSALDEADEDEGPKASGRLPSHYAPEAPVQVVGSSALDSVIAQARSGGTVAVLARTPAANRGNRGENDVDWVLMPTDPLDYARALYAELRRADDRSPAIILVEAVPDTSDWKAIRDRLQRAAA